MVRHNTIRAKCPVVGDPSVGKSTLIQMFTRTVDFPLAYNMTHAVEVSSKAVHIPETEDRVELFFLDCSGRAFYAPFRYKLIHDPSVVCVVFDVTNEESFRNASKWLEEVKQKGGDELLPGVLVGTKIDLTDLRVISPMAGKDVANSLGLTYFECSAKERKDLELPFFYLANEWHRIYMEKTDGFRRFMVH
ncbi:unnamed protein product [Darwinula stevensoni]|uniref:Uncharacterized protein n=1 Tax=Darwinula stevensoni TaxID=69355 RepID=A0A7R8ZX82_9CRUS|nr:unnamed protein product [Darwinula stevensoni]CAG0878871.1 unnamed protein product [Darwinula stevensoni]